jgi:hypothetical protein
LERRGDGCYHATLNRAIFAEMDFPRVIERSFRER